MAARTKIRDEGLVVVRVIVGSQGLIDMNYYLKSPHSPQQSPDGLLQVSAHTVAKPSGPAGLAQSPGHILAEISI